ncbi:MAG: DUF2314 domain-containing protein, partial [Planctomycetes bacterium]|nr:DUF2314 domain-containing protein [Planctomycetota bacterium]
SCYLPLHGLAFHEGFVSPWMILVALGYVLAVGLWLERPWARPLGLALLAASMLLVIVDLTISEFAWWRPVVLIGLSVCVWQFLQWRIETPADEERSFMSLVLLFREPVFLEPRMLAELASRAWDARVEVATEEDADEQVGAKDARSLIIGRSPQFACSHYPGLFAIQNVGQPYFDDTQAVAESVREMRVRQAIELHRAWVSVDVVQWFGDNDEKGKEQAYRMIGRLLAELADENCLAVVEPFEARVFAWDPTTEDKLRSENPLEALFEWYYPPVLAIEADDPEMQTAVDEARRRWPDFLAAFESRHEQHGTDEPPFLVKAPFTDGEHVEYMWVRVTGFENEIIYGVLENTPANVASVTEGNRVRVRLDNLNDWMCIIDGKPAGAFTLQVLARKSRSDSPPPSD